MRQLPIIDLFEFLLVTKTWLNIKIEELREVISWGIINTRHEQVNQQWRIFKTIPKDMYKIVHQSETGTSSKTPH